MFGRKNNPKVFGFIALSTLSQFCVRLNYIKLQCWKVKKWLHIANIKPISNLAKFDTQSWLVVDVKAGSR